MRPQEKDLQQSLEDALPTEFADTRPATDQPLIDDVAAGENASFENPASWTYSSVEADESSDAAEEVNTSNRIWKGFMTARWMVAFLLLLWQAAETFFFSSAAVWPVVLCAVYCFDALRVRFSLKPVPIGQPFERYWLRTLGVDFWVYFLVLWFGHGEIINYIPMLGLPLLICAVLGTWRLTLITAAISTALVGLIRWRTTKELPLESGLMQYALSALYMLSVFFVASILHRMMRNYMTQQTRARISRHMLHLQSRIQDMVAQSVPDGVLVIGSSHRLRAINETAQHMLRMPAQTNWVGRPIESIAQLEPLLPVAFQSMAEGKSLSTEVFLFSEENKDLHLMVNSRVSKPMDETVGKETLCLIYLQDMQELQTQVRTEKLAAMGRMSAAVAHEIRNPLAAIGQASQLLQEELNDPLQQKLNGMIQENVQRLGRIVSDILDIARMQQSPAEINAAIVLDEAVQQLCDEWMMQNQVPHLLRVHLQAPQLWAKFEYEHFRRIMVNLLDNALKYGHQEDRLIVVSTRVQDGMVSMQVWSKGEPLPASVQARLFEPFAAGPSRSTGLGLYICRELCQRYQADIQYHRLPLPPFAQVKLPQEPAPAVPHSHDKDRPQGNAFSVWMQLVPAKKPTI